MKTFIPGEYILAQEMNKNFEELASRLDSLQVTANINIDPNNYVNHPEDANALTISRIGKQVWINGSVRNKKQFENNDYFTLAIAGSLPECCRPKIKTTIGCTTTRAGAAFVCEVQPSGLMSIHATVSCPPGWVINISGGYQV